MQLIPDPLCSIHSDCSHLPLPQMILHVTVACAYLSLASLHYKLIIVSFNRKRTHIFRVIGQFVAKAMLDSRIIDLHVNKIFLKLILGEPVALTIDNLKVRYLDTRSLQFDLLLLLYSA